MPNGYIIGQKEALHMELQQLRYFKAAAETGKISEAAESLFVSAPALSTSISRLEKELGIPLFDRTNNRIILNPQGQIFLSHVNHIFTTLDEAKLEMRQSLIQQGPHLSIISLNTAVWVNLITTFLSEYPQYTLSSSTVTLTQLAQHGFHSPNNFLLAYETDIPPFLENELDSIPLFRASLMVALHKDHPLAGEAELDIRMLKDEKLFLPFPGFPLYARLEKLFALYDIPLPAENVYSLLIRQKMIAENQGITFISDHAIQAIYSPNIRYIPLVTPFEPWKARLYWHKHRPLNGHEAAFRDFCLQYYSNLHNV